MDALLTASRYAPCGFSHVIKINSMDTDVPQPAQPLEQSDDMTAGVSAWQWHWSPGTHCWQCRGHSRPDGRIGCWSRCRAGGGQPRRANDCTGWRGQYWNGGASNGASHRRPSDAAARGVSGEHGWHSCVGHVTLARIGSGGSDCRKLPGRAPTANHSHTGCRIGIYRYR